MATPLSLYVPIKQDATSQATAQAMYTDFIATITDTLNSTKIVHYARLVLIPNESGTGTNAIMLVTTFDGAMNPYLNTFWSAGDNFHTFVNTVANIALNPSPLPIETLSAFENFINSNNLSQPSDLYQAYNDTVNQILAYNEG